MRNIVTEIRKRYTMYIQNMTDYPDWVMKYKKKGTLVQRKRG